MGKKIITAVSCIAVLTIFVGILSCRHSTPTSAALSPCEYQLQIIALCKGDWASVNKKDANDTPTWEDLKDELKPYAERYGWTNGFPVCPNGGIYTIGRVGQPPICSIGGSGHSLP
jgi:hypothetical protein